MALCLLFYVVVLDYYFNDVGCFNFFVHCKSPWIRVEYMFSK